MSDPTATDPASLFPPVPESRTAPADTLATATERPHPPGALAPRTRWAAIIWGAALAAIAGFALWITMSPARRTAFAEWMVGLSPAAAAAYLVLAIGAVVLVAGVVGITRRAQRGLEHRRAASATVSSGAEEM